MEEELQLLIEEAYEMRCAFTHGGTSISIGTLSADRPNRVYVKHYISKKVTYSPSLRWFSKVVSAVLTNFLEHQKKTSVEEKLSYLAREEGIIHVKTKTAIESGRVVTTKDVDLDFKQ